MNSQMKKILHDIKYDFFVEKQMHIPKFCIYNKFKLQFWKKTILIDYTKL